MSGEAELDLAGRRVIFYHTTFLYLARCPNEDLEFWPILEMTMMQKIEENEVRTHFSDKTLVNKHVANTKECLCTVGH